MKKHTKCQFSKACLNNAEYALYRTMPDDKKVWSKVWITVCDEHEKLIGAENLARVGGYLHGKQKEK